MNDEFQPLDHGVRSNDSAYADLGSLDRVAPGPGGVRVQPLPFAVGIVDSEPMLAEVQALRGTAYGRRASDVGAAYSRPDPRDRAPSMTIFYAREKSSGDLIGTARLQTNLEGPLEIEASLDLPVERRGELLCEVSRLAVAPGCVHPVRLALVKTIHLFCIANQIGGVIAGSNRSLLRQYTSLGFSCLYGDDRSVPLAHGHGLSYRVLFRDTVTSEAQSRARAHPNHEFVFRTYHPDIQVFDAVLYRSHVGLGARDRYSSKAA